jgi:peptidoglycan hydrolase-like protein with peptidoglycan-binding domain
MRGLTLTNPRRWVGAGAGIVLAAGIAVVVVGLGLLPTTQAAAEDPPASISTASVERRTLVSQEELSGTLGYDGDLRVVNGIETSGSADVASLSQAVVTAQAAYDQAVRTLAAINDPTPENIASARAQVRSAEANLLSARIAAKGSTTSQLESAAAQVAQAQATLAQAKASATGPTASQLAQAQAQLAQAQASLISAQNAASGPSTAQRTQAEANLARAQIALTTDTQALSAAQQALAVCQATSAPAPTPTPDPEDPEAEPAPTPTPAPPVDCTSAQQAVTQAEARIASDHQDILVAQAQLAELTSPAAQSEAQAGLASAQAQLATAQAALDELTSPDASAQATAQLAAAEAAARSAQASLDELTSPDSEAQRDAQVKSAQAQLSAAQASLAAILNPTAAALADAQSNVTVSKASLDAAKKKLDQLRGTVTWLPLEGAVIERGDPLYELDGEPSGILMYGSRPAWREMSEGLEGEDVRQLQENLIALGFGDSLTASGVFDAATTAAVKAWQAGLGHPETGVVGFGVVVFQPGAVRVSAQAVALGDTVTSGIEVLAATSTERTVTVDLSADDQALVTVGDEVEVDLPDGTRTTGRVATVGTVATPPEEGQGSTPTIEVTIALDEPGATGTVDQAPVDVLITTLAREDVLAVPVNALLALLEGGYAVEVMGADGATHLVGVETGVFEDGWVEVDVPSGGLAEGDQVVVPS